MSAGSIPAAAGHRDWVTQAGHYGTDIVQALSQIPDAIRVLAGVVSGHPQGKAPMPGSVAAAVIVALVIVWAYHRLKPRKPQG